MPTPFVVRYDFRAPGAPAQERQALYRRSLEQAAYVDRHGFDAIMLSEHHAASDGYLPSPLVVAAGMAAVTERIPITVSALLGNLYEPVRLAEDIAVLDHLSAGRVSYTFGLGYRPEEYDLHQRDWAGRGPDLEAMIAAVLGLWRGEEVAGQRVTPRPFSQPHPTLFYGGGSPAAARRAARLGLHFQPQGADRALREVYEDECRAHGREPGLTLMPPSGPAYVFCSEDPDRFWAEHGSHLLADAQAYAAWGQPGTASFVADASASVEELRAAGNYLVRTPEELVEQCRDSRIRLVSTHPGCGSLPEGPSWESLRLLAERVRPILTADGAARSGEPATASTGSPRTTASPGPGGRASVTPPRRSRRQSG